VTTGGQKYFWVAYDDEGHVKYWVVWGRHDSKWAVTDSRNKTLAQFGSPAAGKKYAESLESKNPRGIGFRAGKKQSNPRGTPWGAVDSVKPLTRGISWVTTPGHGGLMISKAFAEKHLTPAALKHGEWYGDRYTGKGYYCYEEDCAWAIPMWELPQFWPETFKHMKECQTKEAQRQYLHELLSRYFADYLLEIGVQPVESQYASYRERKLDERMRREKHPDLITSAISTDDPNIVKVWTADGKIHFVTKESYHAREGLNLLSKCELVATPTPKGVGLGGFEYNPRRHNNFNWRALDSETLRKIARSRLGAALKVDEMSDEAIIEEMEAYDRFVALQKKQGRRIPYPELPTPKGMTERGFVYNPRQNPLRKEKNVRRGRGAYGKNRGHHEFVHSGLVFRKGPYYYFVEKTFRRKGRLPGEVIQGATGLVLDPVSNEEYEYMTSQEGLEEFVTSMGLYDAWAEPGETLSDFITRGYETEGDSFIWDVAPLEAEEAMRRHGFGEDEYPIIHVVSVGRVFKPENEYDELFDPVLLNEVEMHEKGMFADV
jgi:hypothetical protein